MSKARESSAVKPKSAEDLSLVITIENKIVSFRLTNQGDTPHQFFDALELNWSGLPRHTWIQVLKDDETLYKEWPVDEGDSYWSPNLLSNTLSDIVTRIPAELDTLEAGESRTLILPVEEFFGRSRFDRKIQGYKVRVVCHLFLDAELNHYFESRSDWVPLEF